MRIDEALFTHITSNAAVGALVTKRVYPVAMPQKPTYPAVVFTFVSGVALESIEGSSNLTTSRVQLDCWSTDYSQAKDLARAVRTALQGFRGVMGGGSGVDVDSVLFEGGDAGRDTFDDELKIYGVQQDCMVTFYDPAS